jgi:hypothetical protein
VEKSAVENLMTNSSQPLDFKIIESALTEAAQTVNNLLKSYSDKDWNYSRITLKTAPLTEISGPYALWFDEIDARTTQGKRDLRDAQREVEWGDRHSSELGMLEIASLRVNKALFSLAPDDFWRGKRLIVRLAKRGELLKNGVSSALWYEIREVAGEEFESR